MIPLTPIPLWGVIHISPPQPLQLFQIIGHLFHPTRPLHVTTCLHPLLIPCKNIVFLRLSLGPARAQVWARPSIHVILSTNDKSGTRDPGSTQDYSSIIVLCKHPTAIRASYYNTNILLLYKHPTTLQASFYYTSILLLYKHPKINKILK